MTCKACSKDLTKAATLFSVSLQIQLRARLGHPLNPLIYLMEFHDPGERPSSDQARYGGNVSSDPPAGVSKRKKTATGPEASTPFDIGGHGQSAHTSEQRRLRA